MTQQPVTSEEGHPLPEPVDTPSPGDGTELPVAQSETTPIVKKPTVPWPQFIEKATPNEVRARFAREASEILKRHGLEGECCLALMEPNDPINDYDLDMVFRALKKLNPERAKSVVLFLLSKGGAGEPAYQISKLCRSFAGKGFKVIIPRLAKSAATLIALGADELHMGPLGQLGPIDPQIGGLPALGVSRALSTIASVAAAQLGSAEMLARYLHRVLTVEQIGYCERISDSAIQYAERLLSTKPSLASNAHDIAKKLVHEYKDHNFVIDLEEAQLLLGSDWIRTDTVELEAGEALYSVFQLVNLYYGLAQSKRLLVLGAAASRNSLIIMDNAD